LFVAGTVVPVLPRTAQRSNCTMSTTPTGCRRAVLCAFDRGDMGAGRLQLFGLIQGS
jgi:hypothetical protein